MKIVRSLHSSISGIVKSAGYFSFFCIDRDRHREKLEDSVRQLLS
jgi:hypothetical protein